MEKYNIEKTIIDKCIAKCPFLKLTRETGGIALAETDGNTVRSKFNIE
jgi:hypothetical protein